MQESSVWVDVELTQLGAASQKEAREKVSSKLEDDTLPPSDPVNLLPHLRHLRPSEIMRTDRLINDLSTLLKLPEDKVQEYMSSLSSPATEAFLSHIKQRVAEKPHVLIAYAFVLYLAIFSGGRWIRSVLAAPGLPFWEFNHPRGGNVSLEAVREKLRAYTPSQIEDYGKAGLSFWFWQSAEDGVDIKNDFKARLEAIESLLTQEQRDDIVDEAREIFIQCETIVKELDELVGRQGNLIMGNRKLDEDGHNTQSVSEPPHKNAGAYIGNMFQTGMEYQHIGMGYALGAVLMGSLAWYAVNISAR
jgi:heme oxygenase